MKKIYILYSIIIVLFINNNLYSQNNSVDQVMQSFNCTRNDALDFLDYLGKSINYIQSDLSVLVSSSNRNIDKYKLINSIISNYFVDENSTVQISSVNRKRIAKTRIRTYLNHASRLSDKYDKVELFFDQDNFVLGQIQKYNYRGVVNYQIHVVVSQYFRGSRVGLDGMHRTNYVDNTKKDFIFNFVEQNGRYYLKLNRITVVETKKISNYNFNKAINKNRR